MRITWVTRSFLDYRIPVYKALSEMQNVDLQIICSKENHVTPQRCINKLVDNLGDKVHLQSGEICLGTPYSPEQRSNSVFRIFWQPGLIKQIKKTKPEIVITDAFNNYTLPVLLLKAFGAKFKHIVCYERTKHTESNIPFLKRKFIEFVGRYIDAVHCNGVLCKDFMIYLGYPEYKLKLGNMAADSEGLANNVAKLSIKDREAIRKKHSVKKVMYLFVGGLIPRKGVRELLIAWGKAKLGDATLVLAGDGVQRAELENLVDEQKIDNVAFAGSVDYENIAFYYNAADCFIISTLEDNWSLVVPEAMSCGLPIINTIYNGNYPELVKPENGWIFDPLDENSFAEVLVKSHESRDKFMEMGQQSLKIVEDYTPLKIATRLMETCNSLLEKNYNKT